MMNCALLWESKDKSFIHCVLCTEQEQETLSEQGCKIGRVGWRCKDLQGCSALSILSCPFPECRRPKHVEYLLLVSFLAPKSGDLECGNPGYRN